jgi:hypothetical protein
MRQRRFGFDEDGDKIASCVVEEVDSTTAPEAGKKESRESETKLKERSWRRR